MNKLTTDQWAELRQQAKGERETEKQCKRALADLQKQRRKRLTERRQHARVFALAD